MAEENKEVKKMKKEEMKKTEDKSVKKEAVKKDKAVARGRSVRISPKHSFAICKMIKGKTPEVAVKMLENVIKGKQPVKMHGREVPHQKGKGVAGAKYPKNASEAFIPIVRQLDANAQSLGVENPIISLAIANKASKVYRKGGKKAKRTHLLLEAISKSKLGKNKK
jgi:ribosomal protein L22